MNEDYKNLLSPMEIDAIGEVMNISLGSSATAISSLLERRVDITTPRVNVLSEEEFQFNDLEPAIGVEITYVAGLDGKNIMIMKKDDIRSILQILMQMEIPGEDFMMDDMAISATCEIMNQMMGASATALSEFLGEHVNISTPVSFIIHNAAEFKSKYYNSVEPMVVISFRLYIEDCMDSEFVTMISVDLAKKIIAYAGLGMIDNTPPMVLSTDALSSMNLADPAVQPPANSGIQPSPFTSQVTSQMTNQMPQTPLYYQNMPSSPQQPVDMPQQAMPYTAQMTTPPQSTPATMQPTTAQIPFSMDPNIPIGGGAGMYTQNIPPVGQPVNAGQPNPAMSQQPGPMNTPPRVINVDPLQMQRFYGSDPQLKENEESNLNMLMSVPLQISAEIGRTKKTVKEIIDFTQGTLIVLDKLAGDQVDIFVNGQKIAKGDVVVVDDSFGIKITEVINTIDLLTKK